MATFDDNVIAIASAMDRKQLEIQRLNSLLDSYRHENAKHEDLIGKLYAMACNKEARDELLLWDEFCDLVKGAYLAIHGSDE